MSTEQADHEPAPSTETAAQDPLYANSYAISYRLLGERRSADAVARQVAEELHRAGGIAGADWLQRLVVTTVLGSEQAGTADDSGMRAALRRRLARATPDEQVAGSLVHLAGYPVDFVAGVLGVDEERAVSLAGVIAPPPDVDYRSLGDPALLSGVRAEQPDRSRSIAMPHWTTVAAVVAIVAFVLAATQCQGQRPTLGEPIEGSAGVVLDRSEDTADPLSGTADRSPS